MTCRAGALWMLAVISTLTAWNEAAAQEAVNVQAITKDVERLISTQSWGEAEQKLELADAACPKTKQDQKCRLQLEFARGFLKESQSRTSPGVRENLLKESASAYRDVLRMAPGHAATTHNLALVLGSLGETDELERLLANPKPRSPALTATIATSLGDAQIGKGDLSNAYRSFARAVELTDDASTKRKMIQTLSGLKAVPDDMPAIVRGWEVRAPAIAAEAYAVMFRKQLENGDSRASDSLIRWVILTADHRTPSSADTKATFANISDASVQQLIGYLQFLEAGTDEIFRDPDRAKSFTREYDQSPSVISHFSWWRETAERRHALGLAALSLGRGSSAAGIPVYAQYQFMVGLQVAPPMEEYIFSSGAAFERLAPLDLITELVWLQVQYPEVLDPDHNKLDGFVGLLFEGKADAYRARDLVAIQRHHMVLGPIFAERGQWKQGRYSYDNAIFQLSSAIEAAERREKLDKFHQALPGIKALLAEGYHATGETENELRTRIDATKGALDSDDLRLAETQLTALIAIPPSPGQTAGPVGQQLKEILATRQAVRNGQAAKPPRWAMASEITGLDSEFLIRQQFKILADLSVAPDAKNRPQILKMAWARAHVVSTLIGMEDVIRLEHMAAAPSGQDSGSTERPIMKIVPGGRNPDLKPGQWLLSLPSSDLPFIANLPPR